MEQNGDDVGEALETALMRHTGMRGRVEKLERLTGGATKRTWCFDLATDDKCQRLILQQTASESKASDARSDGRLQAPKLGADEDARLMQEARACGVPAPIVHLVLQPADGLGSGYITERVEGETLGRRIVHDASLASARAQMARQAGEILAAIHRIGLERVAFLSSLSPADEIEIYGRFITRLGVHHSALSFAMRWLREHLPRHWKQGVVHADFRTGNLIVGPEGIRCVLDWEIARIGDPMQDLGVLCMRSWRFGGPRPVGGFGLREDLYAAYEAAGGEKVDPERVRFWEACANVKWAIGCLRRGYAFDPSGAPASLELSAIGRRFEEPLWDFFELIESRS